MSAGPGHLLRAPAFLCEMGASSYKRLPGAHSGDREMTPTGAYPLEPSAPQGHSWKSRLAGELHSWAGAGPRSRGPAPGARAKLGGGPGLNVGCIPAPESQLPPDRPRVSLPRLFLQPSRAQCVQYCAKSCKKRLREQPRAGGRVGKPEPPGDLTSKQGPSPPGRHPPKRVQAGPAGPAAGGRGGDERRRGVRRFATGRREEAGGAFTARQP